LQALYGVAVHLFHDPCRDLALGYRAEADCLAGISCRHDGPRHRRRAVDRADNALVCTATRRMRIINRAEFFAGDLATFASGQMLLISVVRQRKSLPPAIESSMALVLAPDAP